MTEARNLTQADVEAIASATADLAVQKLFEGFGFNISTPEGRIEAAGAMRWMLFCYRLVGFIGKYGLMAAIGIGAGYVVWRVTGWGGPPQ